MTIKSKDTNAVLDSIDGAIVEANELALKVSQQRCAEAVERVIQTASHSGSPYILNPCCVESFCRPMGNEDPEDYEHEYTICMCFEKAYETQAYRSLWCSDIRYEYPEDADLESKYNGIPKSGLSWWVEEADGRLYRHSFYKLQIPLDADGRPI